MFIVYSSSSFSNQVTKFNMMNNYKISKQIQVAYALLYNIEYYIHYMKYKMQEKLLLNKIYVE